MKYLECKRSGLNHVADTINTVHLFLSVCLRWVENGMSRQRQASEDLSYYAFAESAYRIDKYSKQ